MEILYILNTVVLGVMLWDIHRGTKEIQRSVDHVAAIAKAVSDKTDAILGRLPRQGA
jgi:hypothetical protein